MSTLPDAHDDAPAYPNATPWRRDADQLAARLAAWATAVHGAHAVVSDVRLPHNGMANDTVLFRVDGDGLVARLAPDADAPYATFPTFDLGFQHRVIDLVRTRTAVPAPEVVHHERDARWLGSSFLVVRAVDGLVPADNPPYLLDPNGWFLQGTVDDWKRLETSTVEVLVQLHRIAADGRATAFLHVDAPGETALARLLESHHAYYDWARDGQVVPVLERAYERLRSTLPANDRCVLLWGDSRPGNIIYRDFEPVAVLDWEMAGAGPPETDVAWATFFQRFWAFAAEQLGITVPAMFDPVETAATYARLGGVALDDLAWYEALAGYRFGIILVRMNLRAQSYGQLARPAHPDDMTMFAPLLDRLCAAL
jgi:aminoglycoside phosphotransferase (APT) family kinase protein